MNNEIAIRNVPTFMNKELNIATKKMVSISENMRKFGLETAAIIAHVDSTECYKDDGFYSVHEWVFSTFGLKKSASYILLKIGNEYLSETVNAKGKVSGYTTNLVETPNDADFSVSQVAKMLPLGHAVAKELVDKGTIAPTMTCKEIETVVKSYFDEAEETEADEAEAGETEADEAEAEETVTVTDSDGNEYEIPVSVLSLYRVK